MIGLKVVKRRNKNVCERFAFKKINQNTKIVTGCWRGNIDVNWRGFEHYTGKHSVNFVDPEIPWIHTQNIERLWRCLKKSINCKSNKMSCLKKEIKIFEFLQNFGAKSPTEKFQ